MNLLSSAWLLFPVLPIAIWVAWSDMKTMKIPNKAVVALFLVWVALGWLTVTWKMWGLGLALGAFVMVVGFVMNAVRLIGAGDAKFAAVMAPFFIGATPMFLLGLTSSCLLAAFVGHRIARRIPAVRAATPDWQSWDRRDFPMGLALAGMLVIYHLAKFWPQG
jgi:prepilin peptidase CpaA